MEDPERPGTAEAVPSAGTAEVQAGDEASEAETVPVSGPAAVRRRPRRRGRTALVIATAAVLGVLAGTCAGCLVQADREPTALPPLSQPVLAQAKGKGPAPLSAARDRRLKTDGDLRKLLLKKPRGAREDRLPGDGWMSLADYAGYFDKPDEALHSLILDGFRRAATTSWHQDDTHVQIRLVQFRQEGETTAESHAADGQRWARSDGGEDLEVPGTTTATAFVRAEADEEPGYLPMYTAQAHGWRGDIAMEVWVTSAERTIPEATILDLAERQMERL